jgi:hypothetical protein
MVDGLLKCPAEVLSDRNHAWFASFAGRLVLCQRDAPLRPIHVTDLGAAQFSRSSAALQQAMLCP